MLTVRQVVSTLGFLLMKIVGYVFLVVVISNETMTMFFQGLNCFYLRYTMYILMNAGWLSLPPVALLIFLINTRPGHDSSWSLIDKASRPQCAAQRYRGRFCSDFEICDR